MDYQEVLKKINRGDIAPVYYLYGEEELLRDEALAALLEALLPVGRQDFDLEVLLGEAIRAESLSASLRTPPFFAPKRVILIKEADRLEATVVQELVAYLEDPLPSTCLVLAARKLESRMRLAHRLERQGILLRFSPPKGEALKRWLQRRAEQLGKKLSPPAIESLLTYLGEDLRILSNELSKVALFVGGRQLISQDDVETVVGEQRVRTIFELVEAVGRRKTDDSLLCLSRLLEAGEAPLAILGMLARQVRLLIKVQVLHQEGLNTEELGRAIGLHPYLLPRFLDQAASSPKTTLQASLKRLLQADEELKGGQEGQLVLERLVMDLCLSTPNWPSERDRVAR